MPKILLLDDNCELCEMYNGILTDMTDFEVTIVNNFKDAIDLIKVHFDVLIIDVFLYSMKETGLDFALCYQQSHSDTKIIFLTGHMEMRQKIVMSGVNYHRLLFKPIQSTELIQIIRDLTVDERKINDGAPDLLRILIGNLRNDVERIKLNNIQQQDKLIHLEREIVSSQQSITLVQRSMSVIQSSVKNFIENHANDGLKIISIISGIMTILSVSTILIILKCH